MNDRTSWYLDLNDGERDQVHAFFGLHAVDYRDVPIDANVTRDGDCWLIERYIRRGGKFAFTSNGGQQVETVRRRVVAGLPDCWAKRP